MRSRPISGTIKTDAKLNINKAINEINQSVKQGTYKMKDGLVAIINVVTEKFSTTLHKT